MKKGDRVRAKKNIIVFGEKTKAQPGAEIGYIVYMTDNEALVHLLPEYKGWLANGWYIERYQIIEGENYWWISLNNLETINTTLMSTE